MYKFVHFLFLKIQKKEVNAQKSLKKTYIYYQYTIPFFTNVVKQVSMYALNLIFEQFKCTKEIFDVNSYIDTLMKRIGILCKHKYKTT